MATVAAVDSRNLEASGFFVLRTPLLPVDELPASSEGVCPVKIDRNVNASLWERRGSATVEGASPMSLAE